MLLSLFYTDQDFSKNFSKLEMWCNSFIKKYIRFFSSKVLLIKSSSSEVHCLLSANLFIQEINSTKLVIIIVKENLVIA